jgi:4-amino-4-deoxy-L-arabinose transferase-like glycosyltransferase
MPHLKGSRGLQWVLLLLVGAAVCVTASYSIDGDVLVGDSEQTLRMGENLVHQGVISLDEQPPYRPSMYREPIPVWLAALSVAVVDRVLGEAGYDAYVAGERARLIKHQQLFWVAALFVGGFLAAGLFSASFVVRLATAVVVCAPFVSRIAPALSTLLYPNMQIGWAINRLYSDIAGAALLLLASLALVAAARRRNPWWTVLAGAAFGLLTLVKAAFLYVFPGVLLALVAYDRLVRGKFTLRGVATRTLILLASFAAVVAPWMYRNYATLGEFQLTERGGEVLFVRALKNTMTFDEYLGTFYVWGPARSTVGAMFGFEPHDLQRGGRLARLNRETSDFSDDDRVAEAAGRPEDAISFFRQSRAHYAKLLADYRAAGHPSPTTAANEEMQRQAFAMIAEHPFRHLAMTLPMLVRGACYTFPVLAIAFVIGWRLKRYDIALFVTPAIGWALFHALLSHFITRYGVPLEPIATVVGTGIVAAAITAVWRRASRDREHAPAPSQSTPAVDMG